MHCIIYFSQKIQLPLFSKAKAVSSLLKRLGSLIFWQTCQYIILKGLKVTAALLRSYRKFDFLQSVVGVVVIHVYQRLLCLLCVECRFEGKYHYLQTYNAFCEKVNIVYHKLLV